MIELKWGPRASLPAVLNWVATPPTGRDYWKNGESAPEKGLCRKEQEGRNFTASAHLQRLFRGLRPLLVEQWRRESIVRKPEFQRKQELCGGRKACRFHSNRCFRLGTQASGCQRRHLCFRGANVLPEVPQVNGILFVFLPPMGGLRRRKTRVQPPPPDRQPLLPLRQF